MLSGKTANSFQFPVKNMKEFINYAHRGASQYAPENTFASFYLGWRMGANGIETDIQCTRDGIPVLFHDDTMERIAGLSCRIRDLSCDELALIDAGSHKGKEFKGEKIPTLEEFLHHFSQKGLHLALEIKQSGIDQAIIPLIRKYCSLDHVIVTSFQGDALLSFRKAMPEARTGYLSKAESPELIEAMKKAGIFQYCPNADTWTPEWDKRFRDEGFSIRAWGVKNEQLMMKMLSMQVDGMTVNFPDRLREAMDAQRPQKNSP